MTAKDDDLPSTVHLLNKTSVFQKILPWYCRFSTENSHSTPFHKKTGNVLLGYIANQVGPTSKTIYYFWSKPTYCSISALQMDW